MKRTFNKVTRIRCEKCYSGHLNYVGRFELEKVGVETHRLYLHECDNPRCKDRVFEPNRKFPIYA